MKKETETRTKIMETAFRLFYEKGYSETGINEILNDSSSYKKSFYTHFSSKTELGIMYIQSIEHELLNLTNRLLTKYSKFNDFLEAWLKIIKRKLSKNYSLGCPLVNMPVNSSDLTKEVRSSFTKLKEPFIKYFLNHYKLSHKQAKEISEEILFLYEGAMNSYKLDPNPRYFNYMEKFLNHIAKDLNSHDSTNSTSS
ncbi:MAG: TetR/AcrR family transcriptional regulator [Leptospiraceae bacterium]|nr:TetR/AcrR family transcriptional regulator [Leptospiraceae bacterium]MCP5503426.1 TetR/AcrR family transcriptional regulator [Leptospiraceae bacterium]